MNGDTLQIVATGALWGLSAGGLGLLGIRHALRVRYAALGDDRRREARIPYVFRLLLPLAPNLARFTRHPSLRPARESARVRLVSAGMEGLLGPEEFMALRLLFPLVAIPVWVALLSLCMLAFTPQLRDRIFIPFTLAGVLASVLYPAYWLTTTLATRHRAMRRALPFVLDILTLSVEAGMDFMTALQRHVERSPFDPLNEELARVIREIQLGRTRREALRDMGRRINLGDLKGVVNALVQADELGVSIGPILRIQSNQIRQRRFERAERLANEAPVKMLFPLLLFIFPAVFLILLGPVIVRLLEQGF